MKLNPASDHVYINDGFKCSSISIITNTADNQQTSLTSTTTPPSQNGSCKNPKINNNNCNNNFNNNNNNNNCNNNNNNNITLEQSNEFILNKHGQKIRPETNKIDYVKKWLRDRSKSSFTKKNLNKRLPITRWLPNYSSADSISDLIAGITVGLTVIPQALAYAGIAGLPSAYGLYGSFVGCFIYIFLGSCKDVPIGPSAIVALLTFQAAHGSWQKSVLLCLLCGIVELLMGIFGLGFLIDFVSGPVSSGFTSAVSLIILTSQVKDILGISAKGSTFIEIWKQIFENITNTRASDTVLGLTCIAILLMMRLLSSVKIGPEEPSLRSKAQNIINKTLWVIGTSRNAILVIICGFMSFLLHSGHEGTLFHVIGDIPPGLPAINMPPTSLSANETANGEGENFIEMVKSMGSGLIVIPLISLMESISICKAFGNGKPVDASQELIAIGVANITNSFVQGFPGTGALSRGAVFNASGVRTPLSNIYAAALVILSLIFFTPYFYFIPKATLAGIIIAAVIFMIEVRVVKPMWRAKKSDLVPGLGTFIACLILPLEVGLLIGIGLNVIFILYHAARPKLAIELLKTHHGIEYLMITPDRCIIFPSVDYVRNLVTKHAMRENVPVVIDASHIYGADFTTATVIESLLTDFTNRQQLLFFYNLKPSICNLFETLSPTEFIVFYQEHQLDELLKERNYEQKKSIMV